MQDIINVTPIRFRWTIMIYWRFQIQNMVHQYGGLGDWTRHTILWYLFQISWTGEISFRYFPVLASVVSFSSRQPSYWVAPRSNCCDWAELWQNSCALPPCKWCWGWSSAWGQGWWPRWRRSEHQPRYQLSWLCFLPLPNWFGREFFYFSLLQTQLKEFYFTFNYWTLIDIILLHISQE